MYYSSEKIDEVIQAVDLVSLIRQYVDLKRVGSSYKGLCPFHVEKTPSFHVNSEKGVYHCFGCGVGGNAINFIMEMNQMSFTEAMMDLASKHGVKLPETSNQKPAGVSKTALYEAMNLACDFFQNNLWDKNDLSIQQYLKDRGLKLDLARSYRLGRSLDQWDSLYKYLKSQGVSDKAQVEAGLVRARSGDGSSGYYDLFRNRLMIPVSDAEGRVVAFAGRILPGDANPESAKYINSPATTIYKKGHLLFGYHQARAHMRAAGLAFLVEGYFDLLALVQAKIPNVVAAMGTAVTQQQINLLRGQVKEVYLLFDGDSAGQQAASRSLPSLLNVELDGKVMTLPEGEDPDTFVKKHGAEGLFQAAEKAEDILGYYATRLLATHGETLAGQAKAIREAKEMLALVPDAAKGQLLRKLLADKLGLEPSVFGLGFQRQKPHYEPPPPKPEPTPVQTAHARCLEILAHIIIHQELAKNLKDLTPYWPQDPSLAIFKALSQQYEANGRIEPEKIHIEADQNLAAWLSEALLTPRKYKAEKAASIFKEMAESLVLLAAAKKRQALSQEWEQAKQSGKQEDIEKVLTELQNLPSRWQKAR
ncbi:MAG: DNA primase [Deltaproteobacteria bacterium]|nr:DNA primase [Deltaproteobacteria bacterium]